MLSNAASPLWKRKRAVSVAIYGLMAILPPLASGILAIMYASVFTLEEYGYYGVFAAVVGITIILLDFGLPSVIFQDYCLGELQSQEALSKAIYGGRVIMVMALPAIGAGLYLSWNIIGAGISPAWLYILIALATAYIDKSSEVLETLCRAMEMPPYYALGRVAQASASITCGYMLVLVFHLNILGAVLAMFAGKFAGFLAYELVISRKLHVKPAAPDWLYLRKSFSFGLPLVLNRIAAWGRHLALRPALAYVLPLSSVGLFSFASSLAATPSFFSSAIDLTLSPIYFKRRGKPDTQEFDEKVVKLMRVFMGAMFPLWVSGIVFCSDLIELVAGTRYVDAAPICAVLLCATFIELQSPFVIRQVLYLRRTWILSAITIPITVLSLILILMLSGRLGILSAAWIAVCSNLAIFLLLLWAVRKFERVDYPILTSLFFLGILAMLAAWVSFGEPGPAGWGNVAGKMLVVSLAVVATFLFWIRPNKNFILQLLRT